MKEIATGDHSPGASPDACEQDAVSDTATGSPHPAGGRSVAANVASLATGQAITWTASLLWTMVVPRMIGPEDMGLLVISMSLAAVVAVVLSVTPRDFLVREMVANRRGSRQLLGTALLLRLAVIPLVFTASYVYGQFSHFDTREMSVMYLMSGATACLLVLDPALAVFQASERMQYIAFTDVANKTMQSVGGIALALAGFGVVAIAGFNFAASLIALGAALVWARRIVGGIARPESVVPVARRAVPYWYVSVFFVAYLWADGILLGLLVPTEVVGWYGAATRLFTTMMFVASIIATATLPRLVAAHSESYEEMLAQARVPFQWVAILSLPIGLGLAVVSDELVPLIYGPDYHGSVIPLTILGLTIPLMYMNILMAQLFIASGRPTAIGGLLAVAAAVNVPLNLLLIPATQQSMGNGAVGAAVSMFVTELVQLCLGTFLIGRKLLDNATLGRIGRALLAAIAMAGVVMALDATPLVLQIPAGGVTFLVAALVLRLATPQEQAVAHRMFSKCRKYVGR